MNIYIYTYISTYIWDFDDLVAYSNWENDDACCIRRVPIEDRETMYDCVDIVGLPRTRNATE